MIPEKLAAMIQSLLDNPVQLEEMASASKSMGKPDATSSIVNQAMELIS